jgi:homoserine kinase
MRFSVRVPASSANLGPGFDSLALALSRYLAVEVEPGDSMSANQQQSELGEGQDMVLLAADHFCRVTGYQLPPANIRTRSNIPVARGMGSSAAALVAGMLVANRLTGDCRSKSELLELATQLEGHADNLAAALYGGAVLAVPLDTGQCTVHLAVNCDVKAAVFIPNRVSLTTDARAAIPNDIPRNDAVFNAARCALLVHAFASGKPDLLSMAMQDRMHQPYRVTLYPHLEATINAALTAGAYGASLSGSGPSILALASESTSRAVARAMTLAASRCGVEGQSDVLELEKTGARLENL